MFYYANGEKCLDYSKNEITLENCIYYWINGDRYYGDQNDYSKNLQIIIY